MATAVKELAVPVQSVRMNSKKIKYFRNSVLFLDKRKKLPCITQSIVGYNKLQLVKHISALKEQQPFSSVEQYILTTVHSMCSSAVHYTTPHHTTPHHTTPHHTQYNALISCSLTIEVFSSHKVCSLTNKLIHMYVQMAPNWKLIKYFYIYPRVCSWCLLKYHEGVSEKKKLVVNDLFVPSEHA